MSFKRTAWLLKLIEMKKIIFILVALSAFCCQAQQFSIANEKLEYQKSYEISEEEISFINTNEQNVEITSREKKAVRFFCHEYAVDGGTLLAFTHTKNRKGTGLFRMESAYSKLSDGTILYFSYGMTHKIKIKSTYTTND